MTGAEGVMRVLMFGIIFFVVFFLINSGVFLSLFLLKGKEIEWVWILFSSIFASLIAMFLLKKRE